MSSIRSYSRRVGSLFAVAALVLATITPGLVPSFASAAQLNERSIKLSSASATAQNVTYTVEFTAPSSGAGSLIVDFCSNSPLIGSECTPSTGLSTTNVSSPTSGFTATSVAANTVRVVGTVTGTVAIELDGINNPTNPAPLYARIVTYTGTNSTNYIDATNLGASTLDTGGAAISILDNINVSGAVLESLTFCVAGPTATPGFDPETDDESEAYSDTVIGSNCTGTLPAPSLKLGKRSGNVVALDSSVVSTGNLYSQISTNAASGATVNLKSSTAGCGGLLRAGSGVGSPTNCDIAPALVSDISAGQAKFGAKVNPTAGGTGTLVGLTGYNASTFVLNYNSTDQSTGVTSTYGDPIFGTDAKPASDKNVTLTFGASVNSGTPAGLYSADLSLIATGKF